MNKDELLAELALKYHTVDLGGLYQGDTIAGITVWQIRVFDEVNGVMSRPTLTFYTKGDANAFWGDFEPNLTIPIPDPTFTDRANVFIASKITDGTIKFGYIEHVEEITNKAYGTAVMPDKTKKEIIASEAEIGVFSIEVL